MNEVLFGSILTKISLVSAIIAVLMGLDLIFGAPITRFFDKASTVIFDVDKSIKSPKTRITFGIIVLLLGALILLLLNTLA